MDTESIKTIIASTVACMGFQEEMESVDIHEGATNRFCIRMGGKASMLIGEHGNNLIALDHLIKKIARKQLGEELKFTVDVNDYRIKRLEDLKYDVKQAAHEVRLYQRETPLRPMSSFERRIVHLLLDEYPDIATYSIGREPNRRVIIKPYP
jgi:spoIIIJ-associated protein